MPDDTLASAVPPRYLALSPGGESIVAALSPAALADVLKLWLASAQGRRAGVPPGRPRPAAGERLHPEVCNGDLGTVRGIDHTEQDVAVELDEGWMIPYPFVSLYALTHAYAISIHKAQGAEFPAVVIPLVTAHAALLGRTLLYTAFTRARQLVVIVGQMKALSMAVRDWRRAPRYTALGGLLDGTTRYAWARGRGGDEDGLAADEGWWDGLVNGGAGG